MIPKYRAPTHPGEMLLLEFLEPMQMTQKDFAKHINWTYARLNEIINKRRGVSPESALVLADALGTTPEFWLDLQMKYDLWEATKNYKGKARVKKIDTSYSSRRM